jgi:hypothetical protein
MIILTLSKSALVKELSCEKAQHTISSAVKTRNRAGKLKAKMRMIVTGLSYNWLR